MPTLDYQAAIKAGKTPEEIKAFIDAHNASGAPLTVVNQEPPRPRSMAEKVGDFLGISNFGRGLGSALATGSRDVKNAQASAEQARQMNETLIRRATNRPVGDPRRTELLRTAQQGGAQISDDTEATHGTADAPTTKQFISGALNTLLNIAGAGTIGGKAPVAGVLGTTKYAAQPLKAAVLQSGVMSGGMGASNAFGQGKSAGEVAGAGAGSAVAGGLTAGVIGLLAKLFGKLTSGGAEQLYRTSARLEQDDNAGQLLREGMTGGRHQLRSKLAEKFADTRAKKLGAPEINNSLDLTQAMGDEGVKAIRGEAKALGRGGVVERELQRLGVIPKTEPASQFFASQGGKAADVLDDLAAKEAAHPTAGNAAAFTRAFEGATTQPARRTFGEALKLKEALDKSTPSGVFQGRSSSLQARTGNAVADFIRGKVRTGSPQIAEQLDREQALIALQNALDRMGKSKATLPGSTPSLIQRTLLTPALGTRTASALSKSGAPARALDKTLMNDQVRRLIRAILVAGGNSSTNN